MRHVCRLAIFLCLLPACSSFSVAQSWQAPTLYPAGVDAITRIATADLLGLQSNDVLAITAANNLELFANDGAGYLSSTAQPVRGNVTAVAAARFSGTLMDDLLVISSATPSAPLQLMLLPSQGGRSFGTAIVIAPQLNLGATCQLYAADFNGDGIPDVLIFCSGSNNLLIGTNDGKGGFSFVTVPSSLDSGRVIQNVAPGDLDGDGLADIVVQSSSTYNPTVSRVDVLWNSTAGTFSPQLNYISQSDASTLCVAEVDGHPVANLVTGSGIGVSVFTDEANRAALTQSTALEIPSGCSVTSLSSGRMINIKYSLGQDMVAAATCNGQNQLLVFQNAAQTTLTVAPTLSAAGGVPALSLTINAANSSGAIIPTGTVTVKLGTATLQQTLGNGSAEFNPQPSQGANILQVSYSGDSSNAGVSETVAIVLADSTTATGSTPSFLIAGPTITPASNLLVGSPYTVSAAVQQTSSGNPNVLTAPSGSITFSDNGVAIATVQGVSSENLSPWANSDCSLNGSQWVGTQCATDGSGSYPIAYEQDTNNFTSLVTFPTSGSNLVAATFLPAGQSSATGTIQIQTYQVAATSQTGVQTSSVVAAGVMSPSFSRLTLKPMSSAIPLPASGIINTIAGNGNGAVFYNPTSVAVDLPGNVYIGGAANYGRGVSELAASTGVITVIPATTASTGTAENLLGTVSGLAADASGNLFISDGLYLYEVLASTGVMHEVAGSPTGSTQGCVGTPNTCSGYSATAGAYSSIGKIAVDTSGNIYLVDRGGDSLVRKVTLSTGIINTVAGSETANPNDVPDGALATSKGLLNPEGVAVDSSGNVYIAEAGSNRIRKVTAATGIISTVAGNRTGGYSGDGGLAIDAELNAPMGVSIDANGNLYIVDSGNNRIREVSASTGVITTTAGTGTPGFTGDGGAATNAELNSPQDVKADSSGNIYIADETNDRIRAVGGAKLTPSISLSCSPNPITYQAGATQTGTCTVNVGNGATGTVSVLWNGNFFGTPTLSGGTASLVGFNGLGAGSYVITATYNGDSKNNSVSATPVTVTINKATPTISVSCSPNTSAFDSQQGPLTTCTASVGNGATGTVAFYYNGTYWTTPTLSGSTASASGFDYGTAVGPYSIVANYSGDSNNNPTSGAASFVVTKNTPTISWASPAAITYGTALSGTQLNATSGGVTGTFVYTPAAGTVLAAGAQPLSVTFTPSDSTDYTTATGSTTLTVNKAAVWISISSTVNPSSYGATVTFTFTFTGVAGGAVPTGLAQITDGATNLGTLTLNSSGVATITTSTLVAGTHSITAAYQGDSNYH